MPWDLLELWAGRLRIWAPASLAPHQCTGPDPSHAAPRIALSTQWSLSLSCLWLLIFLSSYLFQLHGKNRDQVGVHRAHAAYPELGKISEGRRGCRDRRTGTQPLRDAPKALCFQDLNRSRKGRSLLKRLRWPRRSKLHFFSWKAPFCPTLTEYH